MDRRLIGRAVILLVVSAMSGGCAMKGDIRLLQEELRMVSVRQDSMLTQIRMETLQTQDSLRTQNDQAFELRGDLNRQLQQISQTLIRLEAIAGENQRGLASVRDQLANIRRTPNSRPTTTATNNSDMTGGGGESLIGGADNPDELWRVAQDQVQRGSLNSATNAFEDFLAQHSTDERVVDAHFHLADILLQQGRPEDALAAFQEIQSLFPTHAKVPDALFRVANIQLQLDDEDGAKVTLERLVNTYPGSTMAMLARDMLEEIG
ncbi:MAG: tetratricopeptide repeat protein [Longimicrobiales bacterium]|jgi:tol-pal system protein YbgF